MSKTIIIDGVEYVPKSELEVEKPKEVKKINTVIRNLFTGEVIFESDKDVKEALEEYIVKAKKKGEIVDFSYADLSYADLSNVDLTDADFSYANLTDANLSYANLTGADLTDANLSYANLTGCIYYMGDGNRNFEALCRAIKTIKWHDKTGNDFIK